MPSFCFSSVRFDCQQKQRAFDRENIMPFNYKPKEGASSRKKVTPAELASAIKEIKNGVSIRKTALKYGIDRTTLRRYKENEGRKFSLIEEKGSPYNSSQIFSIAEEKLLVKYLLSCSKMHYGLTRKQAMELAFEYARANSKKMPQSWTVNNSAGKDWFRGFLSRNPEISLRTPEATSLSRATSFNKKNVGDFFTNLKLVREKYNFEPQNIYNCDETGCTTVQSCPKVIANKKAKQVGQVTSADRGTLVTVCFAVNAIGNVIPPFFVFPRVRYQDIFVSEGPEGSSGDSYPSGWMTAKGFVKFLQHFVKYSFASENNRKLLILDNHESHVSIEAIDYAKQNGITLLTIPPHCSNKLQPLDVAIYSSFKTRYNTAMSNWMLSNPGKTVTIYTIPGLIKTIMSQAFSQSNILSGFRTTGIHPFNPDIFREDDFMCSAVTDRDFPEEQATTSRNISMEAQVVFSTDVNVLLVEAPADNAQTSDEPQQNISAPIDTLNVTSNVPFVAQDSPNNIEVETSQDLVASSMPPKFNLTTVTSSKTIEPTSGCENEKNAHPQGSPSIITSVESSNFPCQSSPLAIPSTSRDTDILAKNDIDIVSPEMIRPYPKAGARKTARRGRQPGKTKILTLTPDKYDGMETHGNTPVKRQLSKKKSVNKRAKKTHIETDSDKTDCEDSNSDKDKPTSQLHDKKKKKGKCTESKSKTVKRQILNSETESDIEEKTEKIDTTSKKYRKKKIKTNKINAMKKAYRKTDYTDTETEEENEVISYADSSDDAEWEEINPSINERWYCFVCQSDEMMDMRLCISCRRYVHELCVGLTKNDVDDFVCHICEK